MVVGDDQKLRIILPDDKAGANALRFLLQRLSAIVAEHAEVVLHLLYGTVCDGNDGWHDGLRNVCYAHLVGCGGRGGLNDRCVFSCAFGR